MPVKVLLTNFCMSNIVSTWSPLELVLPTVPADIDYAFYFVTDKGSYKSLNLNFNEGDWLVYIKKDGVGNWYKTNGIVTFNTSSSANNPDPGFYTKVRLDNQGNIIAGEYLQEDDLPPHKHYLSDIADKDNIIELIQSVVGEMVVNHDDSSVKLTFDPNTKTISAEVNYDGITIDQNEFGELQAIGSSGEGGNSSTNNSAKIALEQVEDLTARLEAIEAALMSQAVITNDDSGLESKVVEGGTLLNVNVDGTSIRINAYGQLEVNPDFVVTPEGEISSSGGCATHEHTADQIVDLKDFVIKLIDERKTVNATDLPIDGQTIVINNNGTISAVSTAIAAHTHVMDDIKDLNKAKADTWASDQPIQGDTNVDYTKGAIDLTNFTVGYSIEKISEIIKDITERVEYTESMVGKVVPNEPAKAETVHLLAEYKNEQNVLEIATKKVLTAGTQAIITSTPIYPYNKGFITAYVDDKPMGSIILNGSNTPGSKSDNFEVISISDSYPDSVSFQGFYKSIVLAYTTTEELEEGKHTIRFVHTLPEGHHTTYPIDVNIYKKITPTLDFSVLNNLAPNKFVSGVNIYQGDGKVTGKLIAAHSYDSIYAPINNIKLISDDTILPLETEVLNNHCIGADFELTISEKDIDKNFVFGVYNYNNDQTAKVVLHIPHLIFDITEVDEEKYRYIPSNDASIEDTEIPIYNSSFESYHPENKVPLLEMVLRNNIARFDDTNYSKVGLGPDYSVNTTESNFVWINFVFPSKFRNNIYMDIIDSKEKSYSKNKNGTLNDIKIYVGQSETLVPEVWVNGNVPFDGCSTASGINFSGLDLFRSDNIRRYVTFGQRPNIKSGYIFVKIGISANKDINCKTLVNSILESINE